MQKPFHLLERVEHVVGGGGPPAYLRIVGTADEDADASRCQSFEGVLVRYVVAQVHRHHVVAVKVERAEQIQDGLPLVPVDVRLYLVDHLAWGHLQLVGVFGEDLLDGPSHLWPLILRNEPVVGGYGRLLRLDEGAIDLAQLLAQARLHPFEQPPKPSPSSRWISPPTGLQMSKPWLPATIRSSTPMSFWTTRLSRPLTTHTGQRPARSRTASRMLSEMSASSGRSTIGVSVPS